MTTGTVYQAVDRFKAANAAYKIANDKLIDIDLDLRVARREANGEEQVRFEKAKTEHTSKVWYPAYRARKDAAALLCSVLGIDTDDLKQALS